jgi:hypothetical protein
MKDQKAGMKMVAGSAVLVVSLAACRRESPAPSSAAAPSTFAIRGVTAERVGDHLRLTVTALVKNPGPAPLTLAPPAAQLWIGNDKLAAPFIAPGLDPAVIAPGTESEAATHWWLAASDLTGSLELEVAGLRQPVKSVDAFAIEALTESKNVPLSFPRWQADPAGK